MEILAGATGRAHRDGLRRLLHRFPLLAVGNLYTYEHAAELYRRCRVAGETVRKMTDCLNAAVAIREGVALLHSDRGYETIARHSALRLA